MLDVSAVLTVAAVYAVGVVSPGPNFLAVTHRAATTTRLEALAMVLGVVMVNFMWSSGAIFGLGMVFSVFPWLFVVIKLTGAVYLIYYGWRLIKQAKQPPVEREFAISRAGLWRAWRDGALTNLANPKSVVFYSSVLSAAAPRDAAFQTLAAMVLAIGTIAFIWYGGAVLVLSSPAVSHHYRKLKVWIDRISGALMIGFGLNFALSR